MSNVETRSPKRIKMAALSEAQIASVKALELVDEEEEPVTIESVQALHQDRFDIYAAAKLDTFPLANDTSKSVASVHCKNDDGFVEHIVVVENAAPHTATPIIFEDKIMFTEVSLSSIIEFRFDKTKPWMFGTMTAENLEFYRGSKFKIWQEMFLSGGAGCKRALKSMLKAGLMTQMFDPMSFPSPADEIADWQVEDENTGKTVNIPRPVAEIRVYDAETKQYKKIESRMDGTPEPEDEEKYWKDLLDQLRTKFGAETIDEFLV